MFQAACAASQYPARRPTRGSGDGAVAEIVGSTGAGIVAGSAGTGEAILNILLGTTKITGQSITTGTAMYVYGTVAEIPNLVLLEVRNATDLSILSAVRYTAFGVN